MSEGKPKIAVLGTGNKTSIVGALITESAKNLMATFERGRTPMPKAAGFAANQGTRKKLTLGKRRRGVRFPSPMHSEPFTTKDAARQRAVELKKSGTAKDVIMGYDTDHYYVVWNPKSR